VLERTLGEIVASSYCNNNNNNKIIIPRQCLWYCHHDHGRAIGRVNGDECRTVPSGRRSKTKPDYLGCESTCIGCQSLHPPSPFIIITQPKSWYLIYRLTEGRRLSRLGWLVTYRDGLLVPHAPTHPSTNRVWRSATTLIKANALRLSQTANHSRIVLMTTALPMPENAT